MTAHFTLAELAASETARLRKIDNMPPAEVLPALQLLAEGLERIRTLISKPIRITSGYRCPELNRVVGGAKDSQHVKGEAADITAATFGSVHDLATLIAANAKELGVDQVIKEHNSHGTEWVHVSFSPAPRHLALTLKGKGFVPGIV